VTHATYLDAAVAALRKMRATEATEKELMRKYQHAGIPISCAHHSARYHAINLCCELLKAEMDYVRPHMPGSTRDTGGVQSC
jgi:hypothetical protein